MPISRDFYYIKKEKETPFETFLRYSDQKENSSIVLARILKNNLGKENIKFLDIGTGNGEYLKMSLEQLDPGIKINFVLLEPSKDLVKELTKTVKFFPENSSIEIVTKTWEKFECDKEFDIVLASHLYHISREECHSQFLKMIKCLKVGGYLIFILRQVDDVHRFKMKFKPLFFGKDYRPMTLNESLEIFKKISKERIELETKIYHSDARLKIPIKSNFRDAIVIIEFFLNRKWDEIPKNIQKKVVDFIQNKQGIFHQIDGLALIKRLY